MMKLALFCKGLCLFLRYSSLVLHICLISSDIDNNILIISMLSELLHPFLNLLKGLSRHNFIHHNSPHGIPIVDRSNSIIFLLACCIPDGHFDCFFPIKHFKILFEIASIDGWLLIVIKLIFDVFQSHGSLTNPTYINEGLPSPKTTILKRGIDVFMISD